MMMARRGGREKGAARSTADAWAGALSSARLRDGDAGTSTLGGSMGRPAGREGGEAGLLGGSMKREGIGGGAGERRKGRRRYVCVSC